MKKEDFSDAELAAASLVAAVIVSAFRILEGVLKFIFNVLEALAAS